MKRIIYIIAFTILGMLVFFLMHTLLGIWCIELLIQDFSKYNLGFSWATWFTTYKISLAVFMIVGGVIGFYQGKFWWRRIYVERRYKMLNRWI